MSVVMLHQANVRQHWSLLGQNCRNLVVTYQYHLPNSSLYLNNICVINLFINGLDK